MASNREIESENTLCTVLVVQMRHLLPEANRMAHRLLTEFVCRCVSHMFGGERAWKELQQQETRKRQEHEYLETQYRNIMISHEATMRKHARHAHRMMDIVQETHHWQRCTVWEQSLAAYYTILLEETRSYGCILFGYHNEIRLRRPDIVYDEYVARRAVRQTERTEWRRVVTQFRRELCDAIHSLDELLVQSASRMMPRVSISHAMWVRARRASKLDVFAAVETWFELHQHGLRLDVRRDLCRKVVVVYVWDTGHPRAFMGTRQEDVLWAFVHKTVFPNVSWGIMRYVRVRPRDSGEDGVVAPRRLRTE